MAEFYLHRDRPAVVSGALTTEDTGLAAHTRDRHGLHWKWLYSSACSCSPPAHSLAALDAPLGHLQYPESAQRVGG